MDVQNPMIEKVIVSNVKHYYSVTVIVFNVYLIIVSRPSQFYVAFFISFMKFSFLFLTYLRALNCFLNEYVIIFFKSIKINKVKVTKCI